MLAACSLRAAAGRAAVDGSVAALVALLRLGAIVLEGRFAGIAAVSARRVDVLLVSGAKTALLAPLAASQDEQVRSTHSIGVIPPSIEASELGPLSDRNGPDFSNTRLQERVPPCVRSARLLHKGPGAHPGPSLILRI